MEYPSLKDPVRLVEFRNFASFVKPTGCVAGVETAHVCELWKAIIVEQQAG